MKEVISKCGRKQGFKLDDYNFLLLKECQLCWMSKNV